jgi:hypothetical protein
MSLRSPTVERFKVTPARPVGPSDPDSLVTDCRDEACASPIGSSVSVRSRLPRREGVRDLYSVRGHRTTPRRQLSSANSPYRRVAHKSAIVIHKQRAFLHSCIHRPLDPARRGSRARGVRWHSPRSAEAAPRRGTRAWRLRPGVGRAGPGEGPSTADGRLTRQICHADGPFAVLTRQTARGGGGIRMRVSTKVWGSSKYEFEEPHGGRSM